MFSLRTSFSCVIECWPCLLEHCVLLLLLLLIIATRIQTDVPGKTVKCSVELKFIIV